MGIDDPAEGRAFLYGSIQRTQAKANNLASKIQKIIPPALWAQVGGGGDEGEGWGEGGGQGSWPGHHNSPRVRACNQTSCPVHFCEALKM